MRSFHRLLVCRRDVAIVALILLFVTFIKTVHTLFQDELTKLHYDSIHNTHYFELCTLVYQIDGPSINFRKICAPPRAYSHPPSIDFQVMGEKKLQGKRHDLLRNILHGNSLSCALT